MSKSKILALVLAIIMVTAIFTGCSSSTSVSYSILVSQAGQYNNKTVTFEAFYFDGFEITALAESVMPATTGQILPSGDLIWVAGGISQDIINQLYTQTNTPSGYPEHFGKMSVTGKFETGSSYGHLNAYKYQINITKVSVLEWTPPPASEAVTGNLQIKVIDLNSSPISGVKVVSDTQPSSQTKVTGLTDSSGTVIFNNIQSGEYRFSLSHADYSPNQLNASITAGETVAVTVTLLPTGESADDIILTPNGPVYRANIQPQGTTNPWPPIEIITVAPAGSDNSVQITYRPNITAAAGQSVNNLVTVFLPNVDPANKSILQISLEAVDLPAGMSAAQTDLQWHGSDPARRVVTALSVNIGNGVQPGKYVFNIGIQGNGVDYTEIPCNIQVTS